MGLDEDTMFWKMAAYFFAGLGAFASIVYAAIIGVGIAMCLTPPKNYDEKPKNKLNKVSIEELMFNKGKYHNKLVEVVGIPTGLYHEKVKSSTCIPNPSHPSSCYFPIVDYLGVKMEDGKGNWIKAWTPTSAAIRNEDTYDLHELLKCVETSRLKGTPIEITGLVNKEGVIIGEVKCEGKSYDIVKDKIEP